MTIGHTARSCSAFIRRRRVNSPHVAPQVPPQVARELGEVERALLEFCLTPRDLASIQSHLEIKNAKHLRERYLKQLLANDLLEMTDTEIPDDCAGPSRA
jgi:hypothetical protein